MRVNIGGEMDAVSRMFRLWRVQRPIYVQHIGGSKQSHIHSHYSYNTKCSIWRRMFVCLCFYCFHKVCCSMYLFVK